MKILILILVLISTSACFRENGPKETLKSYINIRFSSDFDIEEASEYLTPEFYDQLHKSTGKLRRLKKLKFISENCAETICHITYDISYQEEVENNLQDSIEVRKVAKLIYLDSLWKIESTTNIKTYLNLRKQINP